MDDHRRDTKTLKGRITGTINNTGAAEMAAYAHRRAPCLGENGMASLNARDMSTGYGVHHLQNVLRRHIGVKNTAPAQRHDSVVVPWWRIVRG